jgi:hypothetical protein
LPSCTQGKKDTPVTPSEPVYPVNRIFNDAARFVAGLPGVEGSKYAELEMDPAWQRYAAEMTKAWTRAEARRVKPVREFQASELAGSAAKSDFVFYPFSGPDVVYVQSFYPNGSVYVLAGLERPGAITMPEAYDKSRLAAQLDGVRRGSASLFDRSFFITNEMSNQMRGQLVDGVLPVALMLLVRMGNTVDNVRNVEVQADGSLTELAAPRAKMSERTDGFEIAFHRDGEQKRRLLYFFRADLGAALEKNPSFLEFLKKKGRPEVLIKSASFLLHFPPFERMREYLLANAKRIVQDDSGIRFEKFRESRWNVQLYGEYRRPLPPFVNRYQQDLKKAYDEPGRAKPLPFSMGYGTGRQPTVIFVATPPAVT